MPTPMRKALVIGVNFYEHISPLFGCVNDAYNVKNALERNSDGSVNFSVALLLGESESNFVTRTEIRQSIQDLFSGDSEVAFLYFSGHGYSETAGGYLVASDSKTGDDGVSLSDILTWANASKATNRVIVLDSCYSGVAGNHALTNNAELAEGTTILTACTADQYATEDKGHGVFTELLVDALNGTAGNLVGDITPGSVYAHIDQSLGPWKQRPVFKTNVKSFVSLRKVEAPISLAELRQVIEYFPAPGYEFKLDPSFEPERGTGDSGIVPPDPKNTAIFSILQKYQSVNLLRPIGAPHMWHAAMESKSCKLTVLGEHYRRLVESGLI